MKFRSDFVTNSSSSNMVITLAVNDISVDIPPEPEEFCFEDVFDCDLNTSHLLEDIKAVQSVEALCDVLIHAVCVECMSYEEMTDSDRCFLDDFKADVLEKYPDRDDIEEVRIRMEYEAMGEFSWQGTPYLVTGTARSYGWSGHEYAYEYVTLNMKTGAVNIKASTEEETKPPHIFDMLWDEDSEDA